MGQRRGGDSRLSIDGVFFAVAGINHSGQCPPVITSNTEGYTGNTSAADAPGFRAVIGDLTEGELEVVTATFDDDDNPWSAPFILTLGDYYELEFFPAGIAGMSYFIGSCLFQRYTHRVQIPGPQPWSGVFLSDGTISLLNT